MALALLGGSAQAAFPGRDGLLAVQPVDGHGIVLARADGREVAVLCTRVAVCGHPQRPRFSPDGRSILFAGPGVRLIGTDGSCLDCSFGAAANPAFLPDGTQVTFVSGGAVVEDGIDRLREATVLPAGDGASDAVWSSTEELAVVRAGRVWVGTAQQSLGAGGAPSWSPNGASVAIARRGWIEVVAASGRGRRRLARGSAPAFSPDGRSIAFIGRDHRVEIVPSGGGRVRRVGRLRGLAVDWQPVPRQAPPACVAPPGSRVLASSSQGEVTVDTGASTTDELLGSSAVMGCLFADGRERFLEASLDNTSDDETTFREAALGGRYAAVVSRNADLHYGGFSDATGVFDLRTGLPSGHGGETDSCPAGDPACSGIDGLVVGSDGVSAAYVAGGPLPPSAGTDPLSALTCSSPSLCLASDGFGQVDSSTDPTASPWSSSRVASLGAASCPSTSLCVGTAGSSVYTSSDPAAGSSSWTGAQLVGSPALGALSCPSTNLCVAATGGGGIVASTDPAGGASAWTTADVDGTDALDSVTCPSTTECIAGDVDGRIITSTDPTGGPSAWTAVQVAPAGVPITSISCPSPSLCLAIEPSRASNPTAGILISTAPASGQWTKTVAPYGPHALSCPSASLCVAVGAGDEIDISTAPFSGSWTTYALAGEYLDGVSCPSTTLCVATANEGGDALVSTDPTGGPAAWTPVLADPISCPPSTACGTEQIIASDRTGVHVLDSSTEFEVQTGPQLTALALSGDTLTWQHSGAPRTATLEP